MSIREKIQRAIAAVDRAKDQPAIVEAFSDLNALLLEKWEAGELVPVDEVEEK